MKKKLMLLAAGSLFLAGCGASQADLKKIDGILEASKTADCDTIHSYLNDIQTELRKKIK